MLQNNISDEVPIQDKVLLTFQQAAKYSGIGENKLREIAERKEFSECILKNGNRKLIKRVLFEEYLTEQDEI
ncbi:MAG: helix-turn-helix domain-containing protein [Lachnospiraceae bacterium]|nr:helix-turn-helix domain-containing protein [Lachnospiraceae bacterium]